MLNDTADPAAPEAATIAEAERLLRQGEPLLAYNMAETGLQQWPGHIRLHQLLALALARSGDTRAAYEQSRPGNNRIYLYLGSGRKK